MILFMTSSPCCDDVPEGVDLPCILDETNDFVSNLRDCWPENARLAVVCSDPENHDLNDEMCSTFHRAFDYHGLSVEESIVLDERTAQDAAEIIENSDVILLGGGHVPTQHAFFEKIGLRELLAGFDGVVIGISAGSMNCCGEVYAQPEMPGEAVDPDYERFIHGLELSEVMILPHYQMVKDNILDGMRLYEEITFGDSFGRMFIVLVDGSYVTREDDEYILWGEGYCIEDGVMTQICENGEHIVL